MLTRSITGAAFLLVVISAIVYSPWTFGALFLLIVILGLHELYTLLEKSGQAPQKWYGIFIGAYIFILSFCLSYLTYRQTARMMLGAVLPLLFLGFIAELYRKKMNPFTNIALTFLGLFYIVLPFVLWIPVCCNLMNGDFGSRYNWHVLLGFFFIMWTADTGAYLSGRFLGKHKLFERISPKKTWEGFIGGVILSAGIAWVDSLFYKELSLPGWIGLALITSIFGTLGDLVESLFKRSIDVKDSGALLPGHGGILDRFDGVFISTPFVFTYLMLIH